MGVQFGRRISGYAEFYQPFILHRLGARFQEGALGYDHVRISGTERKGKLVYSANPHPFPSPLVLYMTHSYLTICFVYIACKNGKDNGKGS